MAVLIDPPRWPAHGTHWSHVVSDSSVAELHAFARRHGIRDRAFDLDHYDVPAERYDDLVLGGAQPVSSGELVRRLRRSGLRVTARERRARTRLPARWEALVPQAPEVGVDLIARWSQTHRAYHDVRHLAAVLDGVEDLARAEDAPPPAWRRALLAAWFHDAVYDAGTPSAAGASEADATATSDEESSAALARGLLGPLLPAEEVDDVVRLVLLTTTHTVRPGDVAGSLLCDADLAILAAPSERYAAYARDVRTEYAHVPDEAFRRGRAQILESLLGRDHLYATTTARARWEAPARANVAAELARLRAPG
ncbi:DUF4031 domain-containing protein [Beutenbergia cavernae]|uniref:DUF4031 domain-containing protein n=1 Tax=Beutenbergia cavernae TaxID=84757 RepID=UPI0005B78035|nr:DUF4031 domain-containing protein [Beutenbergia cavernae]